MRVVIDVETNSLIKPSKIWVIVCKDIDTDCISIFRNLTENPEEKERFLNYAKGIKVLIGHNVLGYDIPVLCDLLGFTYSFRSPVCIDTLIVSKLVDYSRQSGHSIEAYGLEFNLPKGKFSDWTKYSQEMEDYCVRDVEICRLVYNKYLPILRSSSFTSALDLESEFQLICNDLHNTGFYFDTTKAIKLRDKVEAELKILDTETTKSFPPREVLIREFTPKLTKFGTISRTSVPRVLHPQIHLYVAGETYQHTRFEPFNPSSHKQLIEVLTEAGWSPTDKTETHKDIEREFNQLKRKRRTVELDLKLQDLYTRLQDMKKSGWKINEENLSSLPKTAPASARSLAKRILLESRRRTLTEWLGLVQPDSRIHGKFYGIGAWTHRMAHQQPNTANIPSEFNNVDGSVKLLGKEMRQLWRAPPKKLLVGVDAEGIQLRIFAHYIDDPEFTEALVKGKKDDKTDPHSLNQRVLGGICKTRQTAKRFVYALLLGGGLNKLSEILGASKSETEEALSRLLKRYTGFERLRKETFPNDAKKGYFTGLDGRKVPIPGETQRDREHLAMSGYLQNGEAIIIKRAACISKEKIQSDDGLQSWNFVDIVHDELQSEVKNDMKIALQVAKIKADAIREAGEYYKLKCPMAGSYWNEDHKDYTVGTNWYQTH